MVAPRRRRQLMQEALLRENWLHNGEFSDSAIFGLLRREAELS